ncbi:MAG: MFS transporter [marine bacterium B5-7]|nr:MAG: MFS transporter [marine bacterium B5-7]
MSTYLVNAAALGNLAAFYYYAYTPMQLPVGLLLDRYGPRKILSLACGCCVLGTYWFASTDTLMLAQLGRFLTGLGSAFAFIGVLKLATIWLPPERFGLVAGLTAALGTVGAMIGDDVMSYSVQVIGWRHTLTWAVVVGVLLSVLIYIYVRDNKHHSIHDKRKAMATANINWHGILEILKNPQMWIVGAMGCFIYLPTTVLGEMWGIPYLRSARHFTHMHAAFAVSFLFLGFTIGAPLWGYLSDRFHTRKLPFIFGSFFALVASLLLIYLHHLNFALASVLLFILGLSYSVQSLVFALANEHSPPRLAATSMAVTNMFVMLGGMLLQPLVGILLQLNEKVIPVVGHVHVYTNYAYSHALLVLPVGLVLCGFLSFILKETGGRPQYPRNFRFPPHHHK